MKITYTTANPHGRARELMIEQQIAELERKEKEAEKKAEKNP